MKREKRNRGRPKRSRVLIDTLKLVERKDNCSIWSGSESTYVFDKVEGEKDRSPVKKVYKDRKYYTGIFRTKDKTEFSGDTVELDKKVYLIFKVTGEGAIQLYEKR